MSSKLLILFLSTFLLVQSSFGKALTTTVKPDLSDAPETLSIRLLMYVLSEFSLLADSTLNTGKKLFQDVIADISAQDYKNEEIPARLDEYSKLVTKIEKLQTEYSDNSSFTDKFDFMVELSDLLDKSNATAIEKPTTVEKLFDESLKKHGLSHLEQQFEDNFETFAKGFNETAEKALNAVTTEQWPEKNKMQNWLRDLNTENDVEKKIEMFEKFFDFIK